MANELISLKMGSITNLPADKTKAGQLLFARDVSEGVYDREYIYLDRSDYTVDKTDPEDAIPDAARVRISAEHAITADSLFTPINIDGYSFNGQYDISHFGTCDTAASEEIKTVVLNKNANVSFELKTGSMIFVRMANINTHAEPDMQIGGGESAYPIKSSTNTNLGKAIGVSWEAGSIVGFIFVRENSNTAYWLMINQNENVVPSVYCNSSSSTTAKVGICSNYSLSNASYIFLVLENENTVNNTSLTLNINNCGAKTLYINGSSSGAIIPSGIYLVYYNGTSYYLNTDGTLPGIIDRAYKDDEGQKISDTYIKAGSFSIDDTNKHNLKYKTGKTNASDQSIGLPFVLLEGDTMTGPLTTTGLTVTNYFETDATDGIVASVNFTTSGNIEAGSSTPTAERTITLKGGSGTTVLKAGTSASNKILQVNITDTVSNISSNIIDIERSSSGSTSYPQNKATFKGMFLIERNDGVCMRANHFQFYLARAQVRTNMTISNSSEGSTYYIPVSVIEGTSTYVSLADIFFQAPALKTVNGVQTRIDQFLSFKLRSFNSSNGKPLNYQENYQLPKTTSDLSSNQTYRILTTKALVAVVQGGTGKSAWNTNQLIYASSASELSQLGTGTQGQVLTSNGSNSAPSWQTPSVPVSYTVNRIYYPSDTTSQTYSSHYISDNVIAINNTTGFINNNDKFSVNGQTSIKGNFKVQNSSNTVFLNIDNYGVQKIQFDSDGVLIIPTQAPTGNNVQDGALWIE